MHYCFEKKAHAIFMVADCFFFLLTCFTCCIFNLKGTTEYYHFLKRVKQKQSDCSSLILLFGHSLNSLNKVRAVYQYYIVLGSAHFFSTFTNTSAEPNHSSFTHQSLNTLRKKPYIHRSIAMQNSMFI